MKYAHQNLITLLFFASFIAGDIALSYHLILIRAAAHPAADTSSIYFLNVGQGDAELITFADNIHVLIDAGPSGSTVLAALDSALGPYDHSLGLVIISAPQSDHFGGLSDVLDHYHVGAVVYNGRDPPATVAAWPMLLEKIETLHVPLITAEEGDRINIGGSQSGNDIDFISPNLSLAESPDLADTGLVELITTPQFRAVFAADIGIDTENSLVARYGRMLRADILKIGHNGSKGSSGSAFLSAIQPDIAVIEVGAKNSYHEPSPDTLLRIASSTDAKIFRTDEDGTVRVFRTKSGALTAETDQ